MRILFLSDQYWPETNAPAIHVRARAARWAAAGHEVTVLTSAPNFPEGVLHPGYRNAWRDVSVLEGVRVVRVKTFISANEGFLKRTLDYLSFMASAFLQGLREERPEVIVATSPQLFTPLAGLLLAAFHRVPHVFELRDLWPASIVANKALRPGLLLRLLERLELTLYRRSTAILAFTEAFRTDLLRRGVPAAKVHVVHNGTDLELFQPGPRDPALAAELGLEGRWVLGYFGTLGLSHGLDQVIEAAARVRHLPVTFLFMGAGAAAAALKAQAKALGLTNLRFLPRQPHERVPAYWRLCDAALVSLADTEAFRAVMPSKIYEALAMGLPICFVGPEGEASRALAAWGVGEAVPPGDPEALAQAVARLSQDPAGAEARRAAALAVRSTFGRERQAEAALGVFETALRTHRA
jgi:glycosyltransferase involved in cell wall biosynthesis